MSKHKALPGPEEAQIFDTGFLAMISPHTFLAKHVKRGGVPAKQQTLKVGFVLAR